MKFSKLGMSAAAALALTAGSAQATPLRLDYCVTDAGGGQFQYTFVLTLDNHDNTWAPGQAWRWFIFGDANSTTSPLEPFVGDPTWLPVGPWTGYSGSGGGHNGPTFASVLDYWTPSGVGDRLVWQGTSPNDLPEGQMLFSTLAGTLNGGIAADFEPAHRLAGGCLGPTGACCRPDGTCIVTTNTSCTSQGGVYRGNDTVCATANCPQAGACCLALGACATRTAAACASQGGVYRGDGTTCASAACPGGFRMDCSIPGTFTDISSTGTLLTPDNPDDGLAALTSSVTNALVTNASLYVCTNGFISDSSTFADYFNTALPVNGPSLALFANWNDLYDDAPGGIYAQSTTEGGVPVQIIQWNQVNEYPGGSNPRGSFEIKIFGAGGPALVQYLYQDMSWEGNGVSSTVGVQWAPGVAFQKSFNEAGSIANNSVCSIIGGETTAVCYANCDHSTTNPCLNVLDFGCFLNKFAAGDTYANCDNSTTAPVLNVLDFGCFLNKFAAGCSSC